MLGKALEIYEALGSKEGMATGYSNLGNVYRTRGELAQVETMYRKALEIDEALGRLEGMAIDYANLALCTYPRGDLDHAKVMLHKSVDLSKQVGALDRAEKLSGLPATLNHTRGNPS